MPASIDADQRKLFKMHNAWEYSLTSLSQVALSALILYVASTAAHGFLFRQAELPIDAMVKYSANQHSYLILQWACQQAESALH